MAISNKTVGETISAKIDLSQLGYDVNGNILLSTYSSVNPNSKFLKQSANQTCDTTFIKEGNNSINQVSAKSAMNQISMKNLFGLRNKIWCGMTPDEENVVPGPGNKFSGMNINSVEIPAGVSNIHTFLVGGGGGAGGRDSDMHGGDGGSGCIVSTNCDLTPFGNVNKPRRLITVAGGGGFNGVTGANVGGMPGSGMAMIDQDPGPGWGEMQNVCVSFPHNWQTDVPFQMNGWSVNRFVEFNIILYFYGDLAKKQNYYWKGRADDRAILFDVTDDVSAANSADTTKALLDMDITAAKVNSTTLWSVPGNGPNTKANIRVLRVLLNNAAASSPCHFALKLYDESGNEVWNTRKRDGIGFLNFPHQGGRGGTSGRRGNSGGGGGGGGASFVAIESPAYSGNLSLVAIAGGGGGGGGYGNYGPSVTPEARQAQVNYQYVPNLKDNGFIFSQDSAYYSVSKFGQAADPVYTLKYTDQSVTISPNGGAGDFDYGGAGGGGGGGGKCGALFLYADHFGNQVTWTGVSSTGGSNGISGTWTKNLYNDRVSIGDTGINFGYFPSIIDGQTGSQHYNIGTVNKVPMYSTNLQLWRGTNITEHYKYTPGMGGGRTVAGSIQNDGNMGFAYVEWDAGLQYGSNKSWKIYMDGMQNGIAYTGVANQTGSITSTCWFMSPDFDTTAAGNFSINVTKHYGDDITIVKNPSFQHSVSLIASSTTFPKTVSGIIKVDATHNSETKTFYFGYILEWKLEFNGNAGATYVINTAYPVSIEEHG